MRNDNEICDSCGNNYIGWCENVDKSLINCSKYTKKGCKPIDQKGSLSKANKEDINNEI